MWFLNGGIDGRCDYKLPLGTVEKPSDLVVSFIVILPCYACCLAASFDIIGGFCLLLSMGVHPAPPLTRMLQPLTSSVRTT